MSRQFIIHCDNITFSDYRSRPRVAVATTGYKLMEYIYEDYCIDKQKLKTGELQLWSNPLGTCNRIRIDLLETIPSNIMDVWIRYSNTITHHPNHPLVQNEQMTNA